MASARKKVWVGFDLGGTKMLATAFDGSFKALGRKRRKTKASKGLEAGLERVVGTIRGALDGAAVAPDRIAGIGIGCPGPVDMERGVVLETPSLGWKKVGVKAALEEAFGCPVAVANDVDLGVYGEYRRGAARGARCVVGAFPGTGIGGGCVYQGRIFHGKAASCMEIGHIPVAVDGPLCGCGRRGCLETYAGRLAIAAAAATAVQRGQAPHLLRLAGTDPADIRSGALAAAVKAGDLAVERIVRDAAWRLGWALAGIVNLMAPDVVLLGGGLVEAMPELYRGEVERSLEDRVMPSYRDSFRIAIADLGDEATVTGAAAWVRRTVEGDD